MQRWKRTLKSAGMGCIALLLAGGVLVLGGCDGQHKAPEAAQPNDSQTVVVGESLTYGETSLSLPEGTEDVYAIREVADQVLIVTNQGLFTSADCGDTWVKDDSFPAATYSKAAVGASGEVAWCGDTEVITLWKPDGSIREVHSDFPEDKICYTMEFLSDDKLLIMDTASNIQVLDTGEDKITGAVAADNNYHLLVGAVNEKILVWNQTGEVQVFDKSGENPESCEPAEKLFGQSESAGLGVGNFGVVAADTANTGFFYAGSRGLFHYTLGGSVTEQLIEGGQTTLGDNNYRLLRLAPLADGGFLALYVDNDSMAPHLKRYDIRSAKELENQAELTLYTLYDNEMVRQEVNVLMQENLDYTVSIEVGVTGENGVTAEDAIKALNTEIMAGEGPDLILLDGIFAEPYIEKGILEDLSQVVEQVDEEEGLARNITDVFGNSDGIYAVPGRFRMPLIMGGQSDIDSITDLSSLADCVEHLKEENPDMPAVLGMYGRTYLETLFDISGAAWITEEGVDQKMLEEFLETAGRMQEIQQQGIGEEAIAEIREYSDYYNADCYESELSWMGLVTNGVQKLAIFQSTSLNASMALVTYGYPFDFAKGQCSHVFVPREIIGVNAASPAAEQAKSFVHDFLSSAGQSQFVLQDMAYPVNQVAFRGSMENELNSKERLESWLENSDATEEDVKAGLERIIEMTGELTTCAVNDDIVRNIVLEHGMNYLDGQESLEQAVNAIVQGLELRMAE